MVRLSIVFNVYGQNCVEIGSKRAVLKGSDKNKLIFKLFYRNCTVVSKFI